jgi:hypothetical protein
MQHYVIKFISDLRKIGGLFLVLWFPPPKKTDRRDIAEISLKLASNTITLTPLRCVIVIRCSVPGVYHN